MTPNRHKLALLTWLIVYPLITALIALLEPLLGGLALPLRTAALTAIMVPALVYLAMPFATSRLRGWLNRRSSRPAPAGPRRPPARTRRAVSPSS